MLSYNSESGFYSTVSQPHQRLNCKNAILLNTKDPVFFQNTYDKTIQQLEHQKKEHALD